MCFPVILIFSQRGECDDVPKHKWEIDTDAEKPTKAKKPRRSNVLESVKLPNLNLCLYLVTT